MHSRLQLGLLCGLTFGVLAGCRANLDLIIEGMGGTRNAAGSDDHDEPDDSSEVGGSSKAGSSGRSDNRGSGGSERAGGAGAGGNSSVRGSGGDSVPSDEGGGALNSGGRGGTGGANRTDAGFDIDPTDAGRAGAINRSDGGAGSRSDAGQCLAPENALMSLVQRSKGCEVTPDCIRVDVCGTAAAEECTGGAFVSASAKSAVAEVVSALRTCKGTGNACASCDRVEGVPACIDGRCVEAGSTPPNCKNRPVEKSTFCAERSAGQPGAALNLDLYLVLPVDCTEVTQSGGRIVLPEGFSIRPIALDGANCVNVGADGRFQLFADGATSACRGKMLHAGRALTVQVDVNASLPPGTYPVALENVWVGDNGTATGCRSNEMKGIAGTIMIAGAVDHPL